jgi:hypothetical protein
VWGSSLWNGFCRYAKLELLKIETGGAKQKERATSRSTKANSGSNMVPSAEDRDRASEPTESQWIAYS